MSALIAAFLGAVQGLTEFLPVSSSAHLLLFREFLGWDVGRFGLAFDVACHAGTLLAVVVFFRDDLLAMAQSLPRALSASPDEAGRQVQLIALGTLPIVVVGLTFQGVIERSLRVPAVTVVALSLGAVAFFAVERMARGTRDSRSLTWPAALVIGGAQAVALIPGVSRSGATIVVGMALGLSRAAAARFGFLLGIPAIVAAAWRTAMTLDAADLTGSVAMAMLVGLVASAVVGYAVIAWFLRYLAKHPLDVFAYYRLGLSGAVLVWLLGT
ncbi:MAG: undecaprenyl-diphosphate phosphatase [Vicinamibacterales bacterium]|nr:hypothetical protein [Acidobacteriota bacterium]MDP6372475.1 undecaprenyl-diphosphate phosphatase [Vicinamibacterales bacterium]MDP6608898.1 undecaprenyl-diphosphate phosphatase [Vicinamibacterales bacterium]HAK54253.1 hypothetical protein [Acidobacteriota bacterium]